MTQSTGAIALVESPIQLLHVLEWRHQRGVDATRVVILAPREHTGRRQLASMVQLAEESGVRTVWLEPRTNTTSFLRIRQQTRTWLHSARDVVVGDPFSGLIQTMLPSARHSRITIVDDGTATIDFADLLTAGQPLTRWASEPQHRQLLRTSLGLRASRFFTHIRRDVDLFTVMPVTVPAGIAVTRHSYAWTRDRFGPPRPEPEVTVIGSSLVESGVLREEAYLHAVATAVAEAGAAGGRYLAHRREGTRKLRVLAEQTGLKIVTSPVPLEIELLTGTVGQRVICFPSTPAYTLPLILAGSGTDILVQSIQESWLHPDASPRAVAFLGKLSETLARSPAQSPSPAGAADTERTDPR